MGITIEDIAKVINKVEEVNPELLDKVTTVAKEAGINITVKTDEERRVLLLVAELMDNAEWLIVNAKCLTFAIQHLPFSIYH